ncbi:hypothetical protein OG978_12440 [Streptomyces sp. NBC_01591]|uniref:DUF6256 family protein n=1 Tax=Streptomyces sp. NBC_01591 TaxID=2975888 RepID=UPI002DDBA99D|nr:DUF6256 family protein [Streptomyces sp. NBC_01591]WSD68139.1 hypothetical protein OG978_12440 [Streptomyces sp. NBC_01591]
MLPVSLNVTLMVTGYLLVMGLLGTGLFITRRRPPRAWTTARRLAPAPTVGRGRPAFVRQVAGTALGGYVTLTTVTVGYYQGVAHLGAGFLMSAVTGTALLLGIALPVFLLASWAATRRRA